MDRLFLIIVRIMYGKEVIEMLVMLYASLILKGKKTIDDVPEKLKPKVQEILDDVN